MVSVYLEAFPSEDQVLVSAVPVSEYQVSVPVLSDRASSDQVLSDPE